MADISIPSELQKNLVHTNRKNMLVRSEWAMGAPFQLSSSLHTAPINLKSPIFPSSPSNFIFYYCKRSPVIASSTHRCAVYAQNSSSPLPKNSKSVVLGHCQGNELVRVSSNTIRPRNRSVILSLVSLFDKRSLWRRIFFASKKVRSIILLNVVTIVYGALLFDEHPRIY